MSGFTTAIQIKDTLSLSTGSPELDELIGGIKQDMFYLFYGESSLIETLFLHILTSSLIPINEREPPVSVYMVCGNYRRERTDIGTDLLMELVESHGFHIEEALRRIQIFTASSVDQQGLLVDEIEALLEREANIGVVLVRGIFKLYHDDARWVNRHVVAEEVQRSALRLRQLCGERGIPLVASGRESDDRKLLPQPEASSYLKHLANVIVYLRKRNRGLQYNRAYLVKSPTRSLKSLEYNYEVSDMGRTTPPFKQNFNERVETLRKEFRDAIIKPQRREAFDNLVEAWNAELGAMNYAESVKMLDLMLLVAAVDNRAKITELGRVMERIEFKLNQLLER
ncbi:hypothetical protein ACFL0D_09470 [Thermoproteota archaeon]